MFQEAEFIDIDQDKSDFSQKLTPQKQHEPQQKYVSFSSFNSKQSFVQPPRELPKRSYSLQPDMATGWKPKKIGGNFINNVFPINYTCQIVDELIRELYRKKIKQWQIAYLGPRKLNSYLLHQNKKYQNPYPLHKKLESHLSQRAQMPMTPTLQQKNLKFNSNFQCGNLDAAIFISQNQYDLFMRVDSNTKGHTNWYFFSVQNGNFVGSVRFNICNFRREKSLYQRGLKPYYCSKKTSDAWKQGGQNVRYQRKPLRYSFLYEQEDFINTLKTYITLTFTYHFDTPNDTVEFAYFIPYTYTRLRKFLSTLENVKHLPSFKTLSGLSIPILQINDEQTPEYNKRVLIITARIHPGQSNSSFVCQGFLQYACSDDTKAKQFRKNFITYVIPMINPDGVVAGNYRTSLFGKDLNRTFNQSRRFAFPQTFHLLEFIKDLKAKYKQKLNLFIDLHGHSVKKNIFMYGPQFNIHHPNYYVAKQLPKILSTLTSCFRFYSCIFRISSQKSTTARATLNRYLNIPFTYTMQSSNGFYYDSQAKKQFQLTSKKLKKVGVSLCQSLIQFKQIQMNRSSMSFVSSSANRHRDQDQQKNQENQMERSSTEIKLFNAQQKQNKQGLIKFENNQQQNNQTAQNNENSTHNNPAQIHRDDTNLDLTGWDKNYQELSDDNISQGNSDSEPQDQDLSQNELNMLLETIQKGRQTQFSSQKGSPLQSLTSPIIYQNDTLYKFNKIGQRQLKQKNRYKKKNHLLPPINCLLRAQNKQRINNKSFIEPKCQLFVGPRTNSPQKQRRSKHLSISQMIEDARLDLASPKKQQFSIVHSTLKKKTSRFELDKVKFFSNNNFNGI